MSVERIMRPGHPPARVRREWSLLVPVLALVIGTAVVVAVAVLVL